MSRLKTTLAGALFAACGLAGTALAAPAYVTTSVTMRAGPGGDYPSVSYLRPGTPAEVYGCLDAFSWCDVDADGERGWVKGSKLDISYGGRRVLLPYYAPRIGLPIVTFSFDDYWGRYYRNRPFFGERERWGRLPAFRGPEIRAPEYRGPGFRGPELRTPGYAHPGFSPGDRAPDDHHEPQIRPGGPELRQPEGGPGFPGGRPEGVPPDRHPGEPRGALSGGAHPGHEGGGGMPRAPSPVEPSPDHHGAPGHPGPSEPPHASPAPGPAAGEKDHGHKGDHTPGG